MLQNNQGATDVNQTINQSSINQCIPQIDNKVQHIHTELMWERGTFKCNTYNALSPFTNYHNIVGNK